MAEAGRIESLLEHRFRVTWSGPAPAEWSGNLSVDRGELRDLRLLGGTFDEPGSAHLDAGQVVIHQRRPHPTGTLDVTVHAPLGAELTVTLSRGSSAPPETVRVPIADCLRAPQRQTLGEGEVTVRRLDADRLRVRTDRDQLIFRPGESLPLEVQVALPEIQPASPLDLLVDLLPAGGGDPIAAPAPLRITTPVSGYGVEARSLTLPDEEGPYTVRVRVLQPPGSVTAWLPGSSGKLVAERRFQVLVLDPARRPEIPVAWQTVREIDPTSKRWTDRLPRWVSNPRAPWRGEAPEGGGATEVVPHAGGRVVRLSPAREGGGPWRAYPITGLAPGSPYLVEIDYPTDAPQSLVVTVLDRDPGGETIELGASASVAVPTWGSDPESTRTIRRLFWPQTASPLLVVSNGSDDRPTRYGRIRVARAGRTAIAPPRPRAPDRRLLAFVASPALADFFGAGRDRLSGEAAGESWRTYYETATRLADWVELNQQDGACLTVASRAGALYPSRVFGRYPAGGREPLAVGVTDLPLEDPLELLLREFDRRGLTLTPTLRFETLLPRIEAKLAGGPGAERTSVGPRPDYTIDTPAVRDEVVAAVAELSERYGHHRSLATVAIELTSDDFLTTLPANPTADADRRGRLTDLLVAASDQLGPERDLIVFVHAAMTRGRVARRLIPRLDAETRGEAVLADMGLEVERLDAASGVVIAIPRFLVGDGPLAADALALQANAATDDLFARDRAAALVSLTRRRVLSGLGATRYFAGPPPEELTVIAERRPARAAYSDLAGRGVPGLVIEAMHAPSLVLDEPLIDARRTARRQPPRAAPAKTATQQPLVVRAVEEPDATVLVLTNPSPWALDAMVTVRTPAGCRVQQDPPDQEAPQRYNAGEHALRAALAPHEVRLLRFDQAGVEPLGVRSRVSAPAVASLGARIEDLRNRNLSKRSRYLKGPSPSFEAMSSDGSVADWEALAVRRGSLVSITKQNAADGEQAVRLTSDGAGVGVQSRLFDRPATGQLAAVFRVRPQRVGPETQIGIAFEDPQAGYGSYSVIGAEQLSGSQGEWRPWVFSVSDLPMDRRSQLRVRFELRGAGQVDIDHLELYDVAFSLDFPGTDAARQKLTLLKSIRAAESALEAGRITDCQKILDGYWARFMQEHLPLIDEAADGPAATVAAREPVAPPPAPEQNDQPGAAAAAAADDDDAEEGFSDRFRGYLPSFLRF